MTLVGLAILILFFAAPLGAAFVLRRRARSPALRAGAVFAGVGTSLYVAAFVIGVFGMSSSTAALGFLALPFTEAIVFVLTLAVGWGGAYLVHPGVRRKPSGMVPSVAVVAAGAVGLVALGQFLVLVQRLGDPEADAAALHEAHRRYVAREGVHRVLAGFLAMDANRTPLARLASNPAAPEDLLAELATHEDGSVVWRAMVNPNLGEATLRRLVTEHPELRVHLSASPNAPSDLLRELAAEPDAPVLNLAMHANLPEELREPLFERVVREGDQYARNSAAIQPGIPVRLLRELARDEWYLVRRTVAANRKTPPDVLEELARDPHADVRSMAEHMSQLRAREAAQR